MNTITQNKVNQYESLISQTKEQKAKKEFGGTSFGATLLAQSADIEMLHQAKKIATSNTNITTISNLQRNTDKLKFSQNAYGYSVDSSGFMGKDFNKAAELPSDMKIHKSSLDAIKAFNESEYVLKASVKSKAFENIDMADTIKHYYKLFKGVIGSHDKQVYTNDDLSRLPKGFSFDSTRKSYLNTMPDVSSYKITNIYTSAKQIQEAQELSENLSSINVTFSARKVNFSQKAFESKTGSGVLFLPDMSVYKTDEGYSKSGVFMGFLKSVGPRASDSGDTKLTSETAAASLRSAIETVLFIDLFKGRYQGSINLAEIVRDEVAIMELIEHNTVKSKSLTEFLKDPSEVKKQAKELLQRINALMRQTAV